MDYKGVSIPMGSNSLCSKLIYHDDMIYEGWISSTFILVHKKILVIMQGCISDSEKVLWIELIN